MRVNPLIVIPFIGIIFVGLVDNFRGPAFPDILIDFGMTHTQGALFFALASFFSFLTGSMTHRLAQLFGAKKTLALGSAAASLGSLFVYLAKYPRDIMIGGSFIGISFGILAVLHNQWIAKISAPEKKDRNLSILHACFGFASLMAPILFSFASNWRDPFLWTSILFILMSVYTLAVPSASLNEVKDDITSKGIDQNQISAYFLGLIFGFYVLGELFLASRLPLFVRTEWGMSLQESVYYLTFYFVGLFLSRVYFSFILKAPPRLLTLQMALSLSFISSILGIYIHPLFLSLTGLFQGPIYPFLMGLAYRLFPNTSTRSISIAIGVSSLTVVIMHISAGSISDFLGLKNAFWIVPLSSVIGITLIQRVRQCGFR